MQKSVPYNPAYDEFFHSKAFYKVLYGSAGCFDARTLVKTSSGYKEISSINSGELVLSINEKTKTLEYKRVLKTFKYWSGDINQDIITVKYGDKNITSTAGHKFYQGGTWEPIWNIARRALEGGKLRDGVVLRERHGYAFNDKLEKRQTVGNNEARIGQEWILQDDDCRERKKEVTYNKNTSTYCRGVYSQSTKSPRGKSQKRDKNRQQGGELRMGYSSTKYQAFIRQWAAKQQGGKQLIQYINRERRKGNKKNTETAYYPKKKGTFRKIWGVDRNNQTSCLQAEQNLAACSIDESKIYSIECKQPQFVYDLHVEDNNNYCITEDNIIVHNSGKSYAIAQKIIHRCLTEKGHWVWAFRKVSTFIPQSIYGQLKEVIDTYGARGEVSYNETNKIIRFTNGNIIQCTGLDDEEKIKSITKITIAWVEEATEFNEQDINQIGLRMRGITDVYRELILSLNPVSELHWIKNKFFDNPTEGIKKKLFTLHTTYVDNYFLDDDYIDRIENDHAHDPNNYRIYVKGEWGRIQTGQEYYKWFSMDTHVREVEFEPNLPLHISWDFNVLPYMSMTIWQISKKEGVWHCNGIAEIVGTPPKNSTEDMCYFFLDHWEDKCKQGLVVYGDATGRSRKTSSKKTDYMIIQQVLGSLIIDTRVPRSNPLPIDKHTFINRIMYGSLPIKMFIHPSMKHTIQDFTHVLEDGERKKVKQKARDPVSKQVIEKFGHLSDSVDYFICEAFKPYQT